MASTLARPQGSFGCTEVLGEGGEGIVYARGAECVKIYRVVEDPDRLLNKLRALVAVRTDELESAAAWPREIVFDGSFRDDAGRSEGIPVGFAMQRVQGAHPLHQVYQPRGRQRHFPKADWAFLLRVARNLAACVHFVHEAGLVIGDLNESNVFVTEDGMVRLIDVDSFQIETDGFVQTCDVGKGELLPPELQGCSLQGRRRTFGHDRFALAVLIFQLLVAGRHPFAGRPLGVSDDTPLDVPLEESIRRGWYTYSDPPKGDFFPPPGLDLLWLPRSVRDLFERAFVGSSESRPSAEEWFSALERLEGAVVRCEANASHAYPAGERCPWCALEEAWSTPIFVPEAEAGKELTRQDLSAIVEQIRGIELTSLSWSPIVLGGPDVKSAMGAGEFFVDGSFFFLFGVMNLLSGDIREAMAFFTLCALVLPLRLGNSRARKREKSFSETYMAIPFGDLDKSKQNALQLAERYADTDVRLESGRLDILRYRYGYALQAHLAKYSVLAADVATVGFPKLEALHRIGVLTAADLSRDRFEPAQWSKAHIDELMAWRNSIELQYWATSHYRVSEAEEESLRRRLSQEQRQMEREIKSAAARLERLRDDLEDQRRKVIDQFHQDMQPLRRSWICRRRFKNVMGYELPTVGSEERALGGS